MGAFVKFDYVNENGDFIAILNHYGIEHTRKGDDVRLLCPFHNDTQPSFNISLVATDTAKKNTFHCFGCKEAGSIIDFVRLMDQNDDLRACAIKVAEVSGCGLAPGGGKGRGGTKKPPEKRREQPKTGSAGQSLPKTANARSRASTGHTAPPTVNPPLTKLFILDPVHPYIEKRIDSHQLVEEFGVGFLDSGVKSMMAARVLIPILNTEGECIAYAGRHPSDAVPKNVQKYLLPPDFRKHEALFNINRVGEVGYVVIVEGFFSAIRLHGLGIPAVALMGTTMSSAQVALLEERGIKKVLLLLDSDEAGMNALPAVSSLLTRSFFTKVAHLPDGEAPDTVSDEVLLAL